MQTVANRITGESVTLCDTAYEMYRRIIELSDSFEDDPPYLDAPDFKEWDQLRMRFHRRWPKEYMTLLD